VATLQQKHSLLRAEWRLVPRSSEAARLEDFLCFAMYSANLAINRLYKPLLDQLGLTYPQYLVLAALYDEDNQTVGNLGDKLFLDSSTLTPLLKRMEKAGYLSRRRDPGDERQVRIRLMQLGRSAREKSMDFLDELVKATGLTPTRYRQLRGELVNVRENLSRFSNARNARVD
jgi:MarR family transcriptional regulator, organic hydroperoxide resistance regulator